MTPVVLVPGLQSDIVSWHSVPGCLATRRPVVVVHGFQSSDSISAMGEAILPQLPERFHLVGWSMGGYVAFELLRRLPDRLVSLVLLDTTSAPEPAEAAPKRAAALELARRSGLRAYQQANLDACLHDPASVPPPLRERLAAASEALGIEAFAAQTRAVARRPDSGTDLAGCAAPVLIVTGRNDRVIPPAHSRAMHALARGSRLVELADCGHCPPLEKPDETAAILEAWFSEHDLAKVASREAEHRAAR